MQTKEFHELVKWKRSEEESYGKIAKDLCLPCSKIQYIVGESNKLEINNTIKNSSKVTWVKVKNVCSLNVCRKTI